MKKVGDVLNQISEGEAQIWHEEGALIVTEVHDYPQKRVLHFWLATGEIAPLVSLHNHILTEAKLIGCEQATISGRKGWERVLGSESWSPMLRILSREI